MSKIRNKTLYQVIHTNKHWDEFETDHFSSEKSLEQVLANAKRCFKRYGWKTIIVRELKYDDKGVCYSRVEWLNEQTADYQKKFGITK